MFQSFKDAPQGRQLGILLFAGAAVCALMIAAYFLLLRPGYGTLFSNMRTMDAATIVAELDKQKIPYRLEEGGTTVLVPSDLVDSTRLSVMSQDLPLKGQVGFELFNKSDMGLTDFAQKINYQRALQGELARTIMTMESVETARIHLSLSERTIFRDDRVPPKASVALVPRAGHRIARSTVRGIQRLVAAAVPGLSASDVVVVADDGGVVSGEPALPDSIIAQTPEQREFERQYETQVRQAIADLVPPGSVQVRVTAGAPGSRPAEEALLADGTNAASSSAGGRNFPLQVGIVLSTAVGPRVEDEIRGAAAAALALDPGRGDFISLSVGEAPLLDGPPDSEPVQARVRISETEGRESSQALPGWAIWAAFLLVGLALVAVAIARRRPRALTEAQRADYVGRFRTLLETEGANA